MMMSIFSIEFLMLIKAMIDTISYDNSELSWILFVYVCKCLILYRMINYIRKTDFCMLLIVTYITKYAQKAGGSV